MRRLPASEQLCAADFIYPADNRGFLCLIKTVQRLSLLCSLLLAAWCGLLSGCASPSSPNAIMDRVDANRNEYETWPFEIKDAVLSGQVMKGMIPSMVLVAKGKPSETINKDNGDEVWVYRRASDSSGGSMMPAGTSISVGTSIGGGGYPSTYPGSNYPGSGYPSTSTGVYLPPIVLGGGGGGGPAPYEDDEDTIVFRGGRVIHGVGVK